MQSHNGVIRIFPAWPKERDARFENLLAEGDIAVSAEIRNQQVIFVRLEKGEHCRYASVTVKFPWTGKSQSYRFSENGIIKIENDVITGGSDTLSSLL